MLILAMIAAQSAVSAQAQRTAPVLVAPIQEQGDVLPISAKSVVDHVDALYKEEIDKALTFVAEDVGNSVSDLTRSMHFPGGRAATKAMYLSITRNGTLPLSWFACRPEDGLVRCDMHFGSGAKMRDFTLRYRADVGPITQVYSWENHGRKEK